MNQIVLTVFILISGAVIENRYRSFLLNMIEEDELKLFLQVLNDFDIHKFMQSRLRKVNLVLMNILWLPFFRNRIQFMIILFMTALLIYKLPFYHLKRKVKKMMEEIEMSFPLWIRQLQILLQSNTVVVSLAKSLDRAPKLIQKELVELIDHLQSDPACYQYYADFLNQYDLIQVSRVMKCLYRCATEEKKDSYRGLEQLSSSISLWLRQKRNQRKELRLMAYQWWGILPLIGVTIVFMAVMVNVIQNLLGREVIL